MSLGTRQPAKLMLFIAASLALCVRAILADPRAMQAESVRAEIRAARNLRLSIHTAQRKPGTMVRIELIGDSTQTDNAGYGRGFCANLTAQVDCVNMAQGGASTKTYREDGLWDLSLGTKPDYMLIQFGHNDLETPEHLPRQVPIDTYEQNVRNFVYEARKHEIKPVLVTPLARRYFSKDGKIRSDLTVYAETMKRVAGDLSVPCIDLRADSIAYLNRIGEEQAAKLGIMKRDGQGRIVADKTHLNWQGSYVFGRMVAVDLGNAVPELEPYVRSDAADLPAEGVLAMKVLAGVPFKIILVGDSTVAPQGGWGPAFCASLTRNVACKDDALNGRSSKSFVDEGAWTKALAEKGQYYFIQFGHNDQKSDPARHTEPDTTFPANLRRYVHDVRAIGAIPILVTPLSRRNYNGGKLVPDGLDAYASATRRVAAEEDVTLVDLYGGSQHLLAGITQQQADAYDMVGHPDANSENSGPSKPDRTHLNELGKAVFARMVADDVIRSAVELGPNVVLPPQPAAPLVPVKSLHTR